MGSCRSIGSSWYPQRVRRRRHANIDHGFARVKKRGDYFFASLQTPALRTGTAGTTGRGKVGQRRLRRLSLPVAYARSGRLCSWAAAAQGDCQKNAGRSLSNRFCLLLGRASKTTDQGCSVVPTTNRQFQAPATKELVPASMSPAERSTKRLGPKFAQNDKARMTTALSTFRHSSFVIRASSFRSPRP